MTVPHFLTRGNAVLICPKCKMPLHTDGRTTKCDNNHCYDISKEGYVNLLLSSKNGDNRGDSKESARARHALLQKGYYQCLQKAIVERCRGTVLDICCGEGYYDAYDGVLFGFDISKEMVRLASKSRPNHTYFVANLAGIPIADKSIDTAIHLFAPFNEKEFGRVLKDDGVLYSVIPGKNHLIEMKSAVYSTPYTNDEEAPATTELQLISTTRVTDIVTINGDDLRQLFAMTPYYYRTSRDDIAKLDDIESLELTVDFVILEYKKQCEVNI